MLPNHGAVALQNICACSQQCMGCRAACQLEILRHSLKSCFAPVELRRRRSRLFQAQHRRWPANNDSWDGRCGAWALVKLHTREAGPPGPPWDRSASLGRRAAAPAFSARCVLALVPTHPLPGGGGAMRQHANPSQGPLLRILDGRRACRSFGRGKPVQWSPSSLCGPPLPVLQLSCQSTGSCPGPRQGLYCPCPNPTVRPQNRPQCLGAMPRQKHGRSRSQNAGIKIHLLSRIQNRQGNAKLWWIWAWDLPPRNGYALCCSKLDLAHRHKARWLARQGNWRSTIWKFQITKLRGHKRHRHSRLGAKSICAAGEFGNVFALEIPVANMASFGSDTQQLVIIPMSSSWAHVGAESAEPH